ncbi:hypothetical protein P7H15_25940 [Paenibacillus larvae]|nr:hypothetical protein [Paenibacillus larvae]MDT2295565.1 hypothetical protein [Paenibacillus larvae]
MGGIDWMSREELAEAIPPVYTEFIGKQLKEYLSLVSERSVKNQMYDFKSARRRIGGSQANLSSKQKAP